MDKDIIEKIRSFLEEQSIFLCDGLTYMSDDITQYFDSCRLFVEYYNRNIEGFRAAYSACDYDALRILAHSVKSNANSLGAVKLYIHARQLEDNADNKPYVDNSVDDFIAVWQQTATVIKDVIDKYSHFIIKPGSSYDLDKDTYRKQLHSYICSFERKQAIDILRYVIDNSIDCESTPRLKQIIRHLEELDYDNALKTLKEL